MAKWVNLKNAVAAVVKTNGNKEITGANMQAVLNSIINAVGGNAGFAGIATPTTNPSGIPDGPTFYIATQGGTYSYFPTDGQSTPATIQDGVISVLYNQGNGLWVVTTTPMSIADGSVTTGKLATGAVTAAKIADNAVTTNKIAQEAVGNQQLAANSVTAEKIGDRSITTSKITNGAVTGEKIANGTITGAKIADGTITGNEIAPNSIESSNLGYGSVDSDILADGVVTKEKLAPFAVDTGNIENGAVTKGKLDDDVVAILDEMDNKANIDGFYDTMGVGTARNLFGKTSVVDTFFRKTIGVGVTKGNGYVDGVKGNSQAWNQLVPNRDEKPQNQYFAPIHDGIFPCVNGHKYYIKVYAKTNSLDNVSFVIGTPTAAGSEPCVVTSPETVYKEYHYIREFTGDTNNNNALKLSSAYGGIATFKDCQVMDLTLRFGAGNEPAIPLQFEEWMASNVGEADYYTYDAGSLLSVKMASLKSMGATIGTNTRPLDVTNITGINPTTGTREKCFPNGMRSAGTAHDEIVVEGGVVKAIKRVGSKIFDNNDAWAKATDGIFYSNANSSMKSLSNNINNKYIAGAPGDAGAALNGTDKTLRCGTDKRYILKDTSCADVEAVKTAMNGVMLYYELVDYVEYTDLQDGDGNPIALPLGIPVEPLGTLEVLPENTDGEALTMCASTLSMQFSIDAAKILTDELPNEYRTNADDKANWQKFLALMNEKLGSTMGGTISVDDAAVGHGLDFIFAAAQAENNRDVEPIEG